MRTRFFSPIFLIMVPCLQHALMDPGHRVISEQPRLTYLPVSEARSRISKSTSRLQPCKARHTAKEACSISHHEAITKWG